MVYGQSFPQSPHWQEIESSHRAITALLLPLIIGIELNNINRRSTYGCRKDSAGKFRPDKERRRGYQRLDELVGSRAALFQIGSATYQFVYELLGFAYEKTGMHAS